MGSLHAIPQSLSLCQVLSRHESNLQRLGSLVVMCLVTELRQVPGHYPVLLRFVLVFDLLVSPGMQVHY